MSRTRVRRLTTGLLALSTAGALTACGASLDAQTYQERNGASSTDSAVGALALRNIAVEAPEGSELHEEGDDATVFLTVTNASDTEDRLVEVTSPSADSVEVLVDGAEGELLVPPLGSTGDTVELELRGLTRSVRPGEYVDLILRFEDNGTAEVRAPIALTGENDREVYTGEYEEGGEEPALQAPAGGHAEEEETAGEGGEEGGEQSGLLGEGETGQESG